MRFTEGYAPSPENLAGSAESSCDPLAHVDGRCSRPLAFAGRCQLDYRPEIPLALRPASGYHPMRFIARPTLQKPPAPIKPGASVVLAWYDPCAGRPVTPKRPRTKTTVEPDEGRFVIHASARAQGRASLADQSGHETHPPADPGLRRDDGPGVLASRRPLDM